MEEGRQGIYLREPQKAFENAIKKGHNVKDTHMYMYTYVCRDYPHTHANTRTFVACRSL